MSDEDRTDPAPGGPATVAETYEDFPYYEEGKVPQYHRYHAEVSYLDELVRDASAHQRLQVNAFTAISR